MNLLKLFGKITLIIAVLLGIMMLVLGNIGGNNDNLKKMVTTILSQVSGKIAYVETLNDFQFFPNIIMDVSGVTIAGSRVEGAPRLAGFDRFYVKLSFWDVMSESGRMKDFSLQGLYAHAGFFTPESLKIKELSIRDVDGKTSQAEFVLDGSYGDDILSARVNLEADGEGISRTYRFDPEAHIVNASIGDFIADLAIKMGGEHEASVENILVKNGDINVLTGDIYVDKSSGSRHITGTVNVGQRTKIIPNVKVESNAKIRGVIDMPTIEPIEIAAIIGGLDKIQKRFVLTNHKSVVASEDSANATVADETTTSKDSLGLSALDVDIAINMPKITMNGLPIASQEITLKAKDGHLNVNAPKGIVSEGRSTFSVVVAPQAKGRLSNVDIKLSLDDLKTKPLLLASSGGDDFDLSLDGSINVGASISDWGQLVENLKGQAIVTTENGRFDARWLNVWGDGLASLVMPSLRPSDEAQMNCGIIDLKLTPGKADFTSLYIDGQRVTVTGSGAYDLKSDNLAVRIKPQTKGIAIGDLSAAVDITGSLVKPIIKTDMVDTGKKAVGLLLGAINPAFLAVTGASSALTQKKAVDMCPGLAAISQSNKAASYAASAK